jgi:CheY-like chemotaxis protein
MSVAATILLVEDNDDDVFVFRRMLKKAQIANPLQVVTDGQQAVDYLSSAGLYDDRTLHPFPFIVFLDLKLPYLNGFDVLTWIRSRPELKSLIVVVLTSSAEEKDYQRAYTLGARSYLVKPPKPEMLHAVVKSLETAWPALGMADPFLLGAASATAQPA